MYQNKSRIILRKLTIFSLLLFVVFVLQAQRQLSTMGTAFTLGKKDLRIAALQPTAYGLTKTFELSTHPVAFFLAPNITLKKQWYKNGEIVVASKHTIIAPRFALQKLSDIDLYKSLPEGSEIPNILHFKNEILISFIWGRVLCPSFTREEFNRKNTWLGPTKILTFKLGMQNGTQFGDGEMPILSEKYIYHHTLPYHGFNLYYLGIDFDSRINTYLDYAVDFDYIMFDGSHHVFEHKALINWWAGRKFFHVLAGYQVTYGEYPDGWKLFIGPVFDLMWTMRRNRFDQGLFGKKLF